MELRGAEVRIQPARVDWTRAATPERATSVRSSAAVSSVQFRHVRRPWPVGGTLALSRCVPFALACTFACVGPSADRTVLRGSRSLPWVSSRTRVSDAFVPALAPRPSREQAGNLIPLPASQGRQPLGVRIPLVSGRRRTGSRLA